MWNGEVCKVNITGTEQGFVIKQGRSRLENTNLLI